MERIEQLWQETLWTRRLYYTKKCVWAPIEDDFKSLVVIKNKYDDEMMPSGRPLKHCHQ